MWIFALQSQWLVTFLTTPPDRLHYPHSGLCFCLPSRGAAHLQRAERVSVATRMEAQSPPKET